MDRLTALVAIAHARLRLDYLQRHPHLLESDMATPKLQSLTMAMDMLEHDLELGAEKLHTKIKSIGDRGAAAFVQGSKKIDGIASRVAEVEGFVSRVEGANGSDPLDGSSNASAEALAPIIDAAPEALTVNGVSIQP